MYKFKKSYGGTPEPQTPQDAPWLRGPSLKVERRGKRPWGTLALARAGLDLLDAWPDGNATPHDG